MKERIRQLWRRWFGKNDPKDINSLSLRYFKRLPTIEASWATPVECSSFVVLPLKEEHDSGYACIDFIPITDDGTLMGRFRCRSDVIHIEGIGGGRGERTRDQEAVWRDVERMCSYGFAPRRSWSVDCLRRSGLLRFFVGARLGCKIVMGERLSSMEVRSRPVNDDRHIDEVRP